MKIVDILEDVRYYLGLVLEIVALLLTSVLLFLLSVGAVYIFLVLILGGAE